MRVKRLHLVDGTFELYRAHFSPRPAHHAPDGQDVTAVSGLVSSLLALLHDGEEAVTHVAVAFDNPIRCFRNRLFDGYKTDEGVPPELRAQFDVAEEAVASLGVVVCSMGEYEADDALATAAVRWSGEVEQVRVLTPDKDLGQVVKGKRVVQVDRIRKKEVDEEGVRAKFGVGPESLPDWLGLVGDTADGIPGLKGFGEKGAAALLGAYGHLEAIPAVASEWKVKPRGADKLAETLRAQREDALLYRKLATLVTDVPLRESLEDLEWKGVPRGRYLALCDTLGLNALRTRPRRWA